MSHEYTEDLLSKMMREAKRPESSEALVLSFNQKVNDFRTATIERLGLTPEQITVLDKKLNEIKHLVEKDADKWMTAVGFLIKVEFVFEMQRSQTEFDNLVHDVDYRGVQYLKRSVEGLKSFRDYGENGEEL